MCLGFSVRNRLCCLLSMAFVTRLFSDHIKVLFTKQSWIMSHWHFITWRHSLMLNWQGKHYAYAFPHINYVIGFYRAAYQTNSNKIHVLQNILFKTLPYRNRRDNATALH